jgi:molybdate transport system permease protein
VKRRVPLLVPILLSGLLAACAPTPAPSPTTAPRAEGRPTEAPSTPVGSAAGELTVFAAASLTDAFKEIGAAFEAAHPGSKVAFSFGASTQLRTQLEQGAQADVFASADQAQMDRARQANLIAAADRVFVRNRLVVIVPKANPGGVRELQDLAKPGLKLVTAAPEVPIGVYTQTMLDRMVQDPAFGPDFKDRVNANVVSREPNVRQVVAKVNLGEADAAVVYSSDVTPDVAASLGTLDVPHRHPPRRAEPLDQRGLHRLPPEPARAGNAQEVGLHHGRLTERPDRPVEQLADRPITSRPGPTRRRRTLPSPGDSLLLFGASLFGLLVLLPVVAIFGRVLPSGALLATLGKPVVVEALRLTALTTLLTLLLSIALGTPLAWLLARRRFPGRSLLDSLIELPMVLPPAVAGIGLLMAFGRRGLFGPALEALGITVGFTTAAVVLAQLFVSAPFYVRAARSGFLAVDRELELVAHTLGVSSWATFWRVTVPVALPSLLGGAVMCWARALGEFGATIMFAGSFQGRTQTMPLAIYAALETDLDAALVLSAILVAVSFLVLVLLRKAVGRLGGVDA